MIFTESRLAYFKGLKVSDNSPDTNIHKEVANMFVDTLDTENKYNDNDALLLREEFWRNEEIV